ncbi:MAG: tRNA lysidine(34) synthetase TilS [Bacteroidales bacterium]|nr:tRNA lysidine(34) synthetase TilS [Bacteroidales bacterium]
MLHRRVNKYIEEKHLFTMSDKVLVALSGGADSVALLRIVLALGYRCEAAHCNFHLRGDESDRDEQFVRRLCEEQHVVLHVTHFDTQGYAARHRMSIEMAARELRYEWFCRLLQERSLQVVAVAHHRDDSVETFLLNLIRGAGVNGLKGIRPRNGQVVRPLLDISRQDILEYLQAMGQEYVTDSTNLQDEYMRNKIRLNVLPLLRELNPSVSECIAETAARLADTATLYNIGIEEGRKRVMETENMIHISRLLQEPAPAALLFEILHPLGFNSGQVNDVCRSLSAQSGKRFASAGWEVLRDREYLLIRQRKEESPSMSMPQIEIQMQELTSDFIIPRSKDTACLDADKLVLPLTIRRWQQGDSFIPFGMKGRKNVSDYLTDRKFSLFQKEKQCVVCSEERIVWLAGERIDDRYRVTEKTKRIAIVRLKAFS